MSGVAILLGQGCAQVAGQSVGIEPVGPDGALRVIPDGPALRPLKFGERARLARAALAADMPEEELSKSVLAVASESTAKDDPVATALALHLAGAGASSVGFAAAQSVLARQLGWSQSDVDAAGAADVDALAESWQKSLETVDDGWTKFVFDGADGEQETDADPKTLTLILARDLLSRTVAGIDPATMPAVLGAAAPYTAADTTSGPIRVSPASSATPLPVPTKSTDAASANPTPHPSPRLDRTGELASSATPLPGPNPATTDRLSGNSTPLPGPLAGFAAPAGSATPLPGPVASVSANPPPHPSPRQTVDAAPVSGATRDAASHDIMAVGIWAKRPPLSAKAITPSRSVATPVADAPTMPVFGGWFDDAPLPQTTIPGAPAPVPWVWTRAEVAQTPIPDLPETQPTLSVDDATDAIAEALHMMADLRGIAP